MSIKIEIVQGFLESGKTSFINSMLKSEELKDEKIVVILSEYGEKEIEVTSDNVKAVLESEHKEINEEYVLEIISKYNPDRIFIECNGMCDSIEILDVLKNNNLKNIVVVDDVISIFNLNEFEMYHKNMKNLVISKIKISTSIVLNNMEDFEKSKIKEFKKKIKSINRSVKLINHISAHDEDYYEDIEKNLKILKMTLGISFVTIAGIIIVALSTMDKNSYNNLLNDFYGFYIIFISLLIEGIPFILIGSFFSGIVGALVSKEKLIKILPENKILSCIIASVAGIFLPICDCGTIPIVKSLIKKGVNIGTSVTFMLAAPIVNPICILSTYYAFQGNISVVMCRILFGILIAIICGIIINHTCKNPDHILYESTDDDYCSCNICIGNISNNENFKSRIFNVINHSTNEFFNVAKYMILGMFICSIFQSILINNVVNPGDNRSGLIIMMVLGVVLSVCSTSDAFIGKTFLNQFSINSVMGFLVVGPMIDIKNIIVLSSFFKKKFICKLLFIIFTVSFLLMINLNIS